MKCQVCNSENRDEAVYCRICGAQLVKLGVLSLALKKFKALPSKTQSLFAALGLIIFGFAFPFRLIEGGSLVQLGIVAIGGILILQALGIKLGDEKK